MRNMGNKGKIPLRFYSSCPPMIVMSLLSRSHKLNRNGSKFLLLTHKQHTHTHSLTYKCSVSSSFVCAKRLVYVAHPQLILVPTNLNWGRRGRLTYISFPYIGYSARRALHYYTHKFTGKVNIYSSPF